MREPVFFRRVRDSMWEGWPQHLGNAGRVQRDYCPPSWDRVLLLSLRPVGHASAERGLARGGLSATRADRGSHAPRAQGYHGRRRDRGGAEGARGVTLARRDLRGRPPRARPLLVGFRRWFGRERTTSGESQVAGSSTKPVGPFRIFPQVLSSLVGVPKLAARLDVAPLAVARKSKCRFLGLFAEYRIVQFANQGADTGAFPAQAVRVARAGIGVLDARGIRVLPPFARVRPVEATQRIPGRARSGKLLENRGTLARTAPQLAGGANRAAVPIPGKTALARQLARPATVWTGRQQRSAEGQHTIAAMRQSLVTGTLPQARGLVPAFGITRQQAGQPMAGLQPLKLASPGQAALRFPGVGVRRLELGNRQCLTTQRIPQVASRKERCLRRRAILGRVARERIALAGTGRRHPVRARPTEQVDRTPEVSRLLIPPAEIRIGIAEKPAGLPVAPTAGDLQQDKTSLQVLVRPFLPYQERAQIPTGRDGARLAGPFQRALVVGPAHAPVGRRVLAGKKSDTGQRRGKDGVRGPPFLG